MSHAWIGTVCAPEDAPVYVITGSLFYPGGVSLLPDRRVARNGWGRRGASHLVGARLRPVPERLAVRWFSFVEDRFYEGQFSLPTAHMSALFAEGTVRPDDMSRTPYDSIIVGMAPGGAVAVWLAAGATTTEVAVYRAQPVELPWTQVLDNPARSRSDHIREELARPIVGVPTGAMVEPPGLHTWERRHARYRLQVEVVGARPRGVHLRYWNGEFEPLQLPSSGQKRTTRGAPSELNLDWVDAAEVPRGAIIAMQEAEVYRALDLLSGPQRQEPIRMAVRIAAHDPEPRITFAGRRAALRLRESQVQLFRRPR